MKATILSLSWVSCREGTGRDPESRIYGKALTSLNPESAFCRSELAKFASSLLLEHNWTASFMAVSVVLAFPAKGKVE